MGFRHTQKSYRQIVKNVEKVKKNLQAFRYSSPYRRFQRKNRHQSCCLAYPLHLQYWTHIPFSSSCPHQIGSANISIAQLSVIQSIFYWLRTRKEHSRIKNCLLNGRTTSVLEKTRNVLSFLAYHPGVNTHPKN